MDISELYNTIIERLNKSGHEHVALDLEYLLQGVVTGSEGLSISGKYLYDLKKNNLLAYKSIDDLVIEYLKYCRKNGIIID